MKSAIRYLREMGLISLHNQRFGLVLMILRDISGPSIHAPIHLHYLVSIFISHVIGVMFLTTVLFLGHQRCLTALASRSCSLETSWNSSLTLSRMTFNDFAASYQLLHRLFLGSPLILLVAHWICWPFAQGLLHSQAEPTLSEVMSTSVF